MADQFSENLPRPRPFTSPGRTNSQLSPAARFRGYNDEEPEVGLTTTRTATAVHQPPAGSLGISTTGTTATEDPSSSRLPRNLTVSELPPQQQASPYIQYLYGALNRGQGYSTTNSARTSYTRVDDSMALEENSEQEAQPEAEAEVEVEEGNVEGNVEQIQAIPQTPIVSISFLLISGKRRVMTFEPETTVGRVKELVWNSWPTGQDWQEERPPTPSHLRILHLGKILQDEDTLKACNFPIHTPAPPTSPPSPNPAPTIVHLAIRPTGPGIPNPGDSADLEKRKSKIATRLVARFSSVGEPTSPVTVTPTVGAGDSSAPPQNEDSPGCTCCVVC